MKPIIFIIFVLIIAICPAFADEPIRIGNVYTMVISNLQQTGFADLVLKEAFSRVGKKVVLIQLPPTRSIILANAGIIDGDIGRWSNFHQLTHNEFPNIVKVSEKLYDVYYVAFSKNIDIKTHSWESLNPYSVGIVTGFKIMEENTRGVKILTKTENPTLMFTLLKKGRVDIIIYDRYIGYGMLKLMGMNDVKALEPPLEKKEFFLYLNKKHSELIPKLAQAIAEMKKDGTYQNIFNKTIGVLIKEVEGWAK